MSPSKRRGCDRGGGDGDDAPRGRMRDGGEETHLASVETFAPMAAAANIWEGARGVVGVGTRRPALTRGSHALPTGVRWPRFHEIAVKRVYLGTVTNRDEVHLYNWII